MPRVDLVLLASLAALATMLVGCGGNEGRAVPAPPVDRIARELAESGAKRVIVFVNDDGDEYVATAGADRPAADRRFRVGSVTKTFTAAVVLQLVDEGALSLDDTLEEHLPGVVPRGDELTIRQLLNHRSGLSNFTGYATWLERTSRSSSNRPIDSLRFAASHPLIFEPGSTWSYSNTNYIALGLIVEKVTEHSYTQELEERILEPLGLDETELAATRRVPGLDDEGENPSLPWAAGSIVSNAHDISRFYEALLSGRILSEDSLAEMKRTVVAIGAQDAGLGIFATALGCGRFWGHDGGIGDYFTLVRASEDGDRVAVLSVQGGHFSGPPDEEALLCAGSA
jgi:D-alanyl-D-alanine carboxypeptidase